MNSKIDFLLSSSLVAIWPFYTSFSLIGGSLVLWLYFVQWISGVYLTMMYSLLFDTGMSGVELLWWETYWGSSITSIHSEFGNLVFLMLYFHILIKIWSFAGLGEMDHTWLSGMIIFIFTYLAGITGAIMPCSILSEVTATVIGSAVSSLSFTSFNFLETIFLPGCGLSDETLFSVFVIHALAPSIVLLLSLDHLNNLHATEYTDEDEMEPTFLIRHEYWNEFIWIEIHYWVEVLYTFLFLRLFLSIMALESSTINYSFSNFEYWPAIEEIDYTLAVPHWYLSPLMSSLVVIPHHYLGFFYVIICFALLLCLPWSNDNNGITYTQNTSDHLTVMLSHDLNINAGYLFYLLAMSLGFICAVVPTGRYFVSVGSSEMIVFSFWFIILYFFYSHKSGHYFSYIFLNY